MTTFSVNTDDDFAQAVRLALAALPQDRPAGTEDVRSTVDLICAMQRARGKELDRNVLLKEIESRVAVHQDDGFSLENPKEHIEWLAEARAQRTWEFWDRYRRFLEDVKILPPVVVRRLDQSTDRVLRQLEDPTRPGPWRRTGMVVGQVQSGKTGHYIGMACKAADAGYRLIVILAGVHNSLRSQTQLRVDEGLLGFDTQYQRRTDEANASKIGVGAMPGVKRLDIASWTNSSELGDFGRAVANNANAPVANYPVVLVVKKHKAILEYVRKWIVEVQGEPTADGVGKVVKTVPLLVIDDEADHASVDTSKEEDTDPPAVNRAIRRLLGSFDKAAYVGYTATPFANIYIDPDAEHATLGADLFPDSFIESLSPPSNYFGPERVFGLRSRDPEDDGVEPLAVSRDIDDHVEWMPERHKKEHLPLDPIPASLQEAIEAFVVTCAARRARGQDRQHNSMLIHVTRFVNVQNRVRDQVQDFVAFMLERLRDRMANEHRLVMDRLEYLWETDFAPTTATFPADESDPLTWRMVAPNVLPALQKLEVRSVNGSAKDALAYYENRRAGLTMIAIGGDKLSRGLTLEGLSVSYYLRASNTYDTLLQMGRWFGYRPGYEDLCRLYTTRELRGAYREIAAADNELRRDFEEMAALGETPRNFGLRVRSSSKGLAVTARNKMRRGVKVRLSYSGDIPETTIFDIRDEVLRRNRDNLERFIAFLGEESEPERRTESYLWRNVSPADIIARFLDPYVPDRGSYRVRPAFIAEYIRRCVAKGELSKWSVLLVSATGGLPFDISTRKIGLVKRQPHPEKIVDNRYTIRRVLSPSDESRDFTKEQMEAALAGTVKSRAFLAKQKGTNLVVPTVPTGRPLREQRSVDQPLLIIYPLKHPHDRNEATRIPVIGFAISFPFSDHPTETEYVVNQIWQQQEIDDPFAEDTDE